MNISTLLIRMIRSKQRDQEERYESAAPQQPQATQQSRPTQPKGKVMFATLPSAFASSIKIAKQYATDDERKALKKDLFAQAKEAYGIPSSIKLKVNIEDTDDSEYLVLKDAATGEKFELTAAKKWVRALATPAPVQVPKRWFETGIDAATLIDEATMNIDTANWDDGFDDKPGGVCITDEDGREVVISGDGTVFVLVSEDDL